MNNIEDAEDAMMDEMFGDGPRVPPMRTFRITVLIAGERETVFIDAHSVTCDDDAAKFFVYRPQVVNGETVLAAYSNRTLRPYLDVEDVTPDVSVNTGTRLN
jgi:hypothetical protein